MYIYDVQLGARIYGYSFESFNKCNAICKMVAKYDVCVIFESYGI